MNNSSVALRYWSRFCLNGIIFNWQIKRGVYNLSAELFQLGVSLTLTERNAVSTSESQYEIGGFPRRALC